MNDKTAAGKLQGYCILVIGELSGMKKAAIDMVKPFISGRMISIGFPLAEV